MSLTTMLNCMRRPRMSGTALSTGAIIGRSLSADAVSNVAPLGRLVRAVASRRRKVPAIEVIDGDPDRNRRRSWLRSKRPESGSTGQVLSDAALPAGRQGQ